MIYLASTSPRRKRILKELGLRFKLIRPDYHEKAIAGLSPQALVRRHAEEKGLSCLKKVKNGIILSADTIVSFRGRVIGKPKNMKDAVKTLQTLQGKWHAVFTGVAFFWVKKGRLFKKQVSFQKTGVQIRKMTREEIRKYFKIINPLDKAGSYAIQSRFNIVRSIKGSFTNAVGLPVEKLRGLK